MNCATTITLGLLTGLSLAPTVHRPTPDRIEVTDSAYAYTVPPARVAEGLDILDGIGWGGTERRIVFAIDPMTAYEVHTFEQGDGQTSDHASQPSTPDRTNIIEHIIERRIVWEREFNSLLDGTHPGIDGPVDYFEISQAVIRVHQRINQ